VPARNEVELLPITLRSLLSQEYPGSFSVIVVDDHSTDGTAQCAQAIAQNLGQSARLEVIRTQVLPPGWTGKLWALEQGIQQATTHNPDYILLTDADIEHGPTTLQQLALKAEQEQLDLVSVMVLLHCQSLWERWLIPAFVFFFQKLYPFRWVNQPTHATAAAAGGCILLRQEALAAIGGMQEVRQALIDDCALAQAIQARPQARPIWLGLSPEIRSLRPYPSLASIWDMVARTAYTQLHYSPLLLLGTLLGMGVTYLAAPLGLMVGGLTGHWGVAIASLVTWGLMSLAYWPTIHFYKLSSLYALCLPAIAFLYTAMTLDSALRHWQGRGGAWKGRVYSARSLRKETGTNA
jgi:hopene-associated glycosyltransferase HpnB